VGAKVSQNRVSQLDSIVGVSSWAREIRAEILQALERTCYNQSAAARILGIDRHALRRKIKKYGLSFFHCRRGRPPRDAIRQLPRNPR